MDYKGKYNKLVEAVKVLQKINPSDEGIQNWVNDNVPELKESEDEKARKHIISVLEDYWQTCKNIGYDSSRIQEDIAWLEKLKVFTEHGDGLYYFANSEFTYIDNPTWDNGSFLEKQGKQKPAWSEEDDSMFQSCIGAVATNDYYKGEEKEQIYDWLKCLKQKLK